MTEKIIHRVSVAGHLIEDLSYRELNEKKFAARLLECDKDPLYKIGGFFVFTDLPAAQYNLELSGQRFRRERFQFSAPLAEPIYFHPGDDELIVVVTSTSNGGTRIFFDEVILKKPIFRDSEVIGSGFSAKLAETLEIGAVNQARLTDLSGTPAVGTILRIIRDKSICLRHDPYSTVPTGFSRVVGKIMSATAPEVVLSGANLELQKVNGVNVVQNNIQGALVTTVELSGNKNVLGTERDVTTSSNEQGDYNLYFSRDSFITGVTIQAALNGFQTQTQTISLAPGERKKLDFQMQKI